MYPYLNVLWTVVLVLVALAHWIFATYYLEVVLLLPLLMDHMQPDLKKKKKRVSWIIKGANVFFYVQLATWAGFMIAYKDFEDGA